ncbi:hypothetical protein LINPERHAP1_LOCUS125 [Linum perenne]
MRDASNWTELCRRSSNSGRKRSEANSASRERVNSGVVIAIESESQGQKRTLLKLK